MKNYLCLMVIPLMLFFSEAKAQTITVDPVVSGAIIAHANAMSNGLDNTKNKLTLIERGQLAVSGELTVVNTMQNQIYNGLSQVSSILSNLSTIKEIADIGLDIFDDTQQALLLAKSSPQLLLFAEQSARDFKTRATALALEVNSFALKGGKGNLMDSGERTRFINHIADELRILRGLAYGMHRAMYWAQQQGFWRAINPWQNYIDIDKRLATETVNQGSVLKR